MLNNHLTHRVYCQLQDRASFQARRQGTIRRVIQQQLGTPRELRALIIRHDSADLAGVPEYLTQQGCTVTYVSAPDEARGQIPVLSPNLVIVAESSLLELLDICRVV